MENNNQVEKFDPSKLMEGVKDRIKATFVSLIPDDKWEEMVKNEIASFFEVKKENYSYNNHNKETDFQKLVKNTVAQECQDRLNALIKSEYFDETWSINGAPVAKEQLQKMLVENSAEIFKNMMLNSFSSMLQQFSYQLQNQQRY